MLEKLWKLEGLKNMNRIEPPANQWTSPEPQVPVERDERGAIIAQAHVFVEQWKQERAADKQEIESLKAEIAEEVLRSGAERRRADNMALDLATALNNIQTLQSQVEEYRKFMSMVRQLFDRWDIKKQPKKERKPKKSSEAVMDEAVATYDEALKNLADK